MANVEYIDNHPGFQVNAIKPAPRSPCLRPEPFAEAALRRARRMLDEQIRSGRSNLEIPCIGFQQAQQMLNEVEALMAKRGFVSLGYNVGQRSLRYNFMR